MSSALRIVIGFVSSTFFIWYCATKCQLMKEPVALLSTSAVHWILWFAFFDLSCMGIMSDFRFFLEHTNTSSGKQALVRSHIARFEPFKNLNLLPCWRRQSDHQ